jgi:apolipoprotein N-acyltransferase
LAHGQNLYPQKALSTVNNRSGILNELRRAMGSIFDKNNAIKVAPVICYESIFSEYVIDYIKNGANFIAIITNDGWWGDSPGYKQHFSFSSLRAIENRRWVIRSANTGKSGIFDEFGRIKKETKYWEEDAFTYSIPLLDTMTFYSKHGDYIGVVSSIFCLLILSMTIVKFMLSKKK